ncbi:hypothetical protein [Kangiella sp. HZ709]|uniref:hypothetical protein n=1 Tax=Kangiella sp. HZ709 TaxID=2666328 RepID=UPI0012B10499|nr:hypothetical protein [Kangiella sp. HZ709]MRX27704.1 hypothetical protein [Kangiella sp. HZ709]
MSDQYKTIIQQRQPQEVKIFQNIHPDVEPPRLEIDQMNLANSQINDYRSSGELIRSLANTIRQWRANTPADAQPAITAILSGGMQVNVTRLAQESFHGIRVEGHVAGNACMILTHQSNVQLLCYIEKIAEAAPERKIGFIIDGKETEE